MSTATMSVETYLKSAFEPDADFVDGTIEERPVGEDDHSAWQQAILLWFAQHAEAWRVRVRPELRVQVLPTRFRVPDVAILDALRPREPIATFPPLAIFEVLSPEDTVRRVRTRLSEYAAMGVHAIYLVDPETGIFERFIDGHLLPEHTFRLEGRGIAFALAEIAKLVD